MEALVIRRFFRSSRLVLSVATIGLAQVLAGLGLLLPGWFGVDLPPQSFPAPIDVSFTVEPLRFGGNDVVALIVVPVAFVGLALFLRTRLGLAVRACADDVDRAALVGIPVRRVHSVVWAIASLLAFLAVFSVVLYIVLPGNPDPVEMPAEILTPFRTLSLIGLTLFWTVFGVLFSLVLRSGDAARPRAEAVG